MKDVWLLALGAGLGVLIKAVVDPWLKRVGRVRLRRETELERAIRHVEAVLQHTQTVRFASTGRLRFDEDQISRAILRTLTPAHGPGALKPVDGRPYSRELSADYDSVVRAWMAVRLATMDDEHGAPAAEDKYEPMYALQWYETSLQNFAADARREL